MCFKPYQRLWITFLLLFVCDQLSKALVLKWLPKSLDTQIPIYPPVLYLGHVHNPGAAWGILQGYSLYLGLLGCIVLGSIYYFRHLLHLHLGFMQYSFGCLSAGILGNILDRFIYGHVIDFIDVYIFSYHWPTFNIADASITIGVIGYFISHFFIKRIE